MSAFFRNEPPLLVEGFRGLLGGTTSSVEIRIGHRGGLLSVEGDESLEILRHTGILKDRLDWALSLTRTTMDTLIRINHEHTGIVALSVATELIVKLFLLDVVEAVDRANLDARTILGSQTIYSNYVSHDY
jgi:hypothetical protein